MCGGGEEPGSVRDTESLEQVYRDMQLDVHVYQNCGPQVCGGGLNFMKWVKKRSIVLKYCHFAIWSPPSFKNSINRQPWFRQLWCTLAEIHL